MMRWIFLFLILSSAAFAQMAPLAARCAAAECWRRRFGCRCGRFNGTTSVTSGTSESLTFTVGSGSNRALLAPIMFTQSTLPTGVACTYNSVSMTELSSTLESDYQRNGHVRHVWPLAPISGSHYAVLFLDWLPGSSPHCHLVYRGQPGVARRRVSERDSANHSPSGSTPPPTSVTVRARPTILSLAISPENCVAFSGVNGTLFGT